MPFEFRDSMVNEYWSLGYVIFRRILPGSLLRDLRVEADKARALAHELHGPQAQRLQPIAKYSDRINYKPFRDYAELPELHASINRLLGPTSDGATVYHSYRERDVLGLLVEPIERPRHHGWHRDWVSDVALDEQRMPERLRKEAWVFENKVEMNQVNCAIYPDPCLWYVPGSHARRIDLPGERQGSCYIKEKNPFDLMEGSHAELERAYLEACYDFPGAVRVYLDPGDFMVYRNLGWHTGVYTTYTPRATIHDGVGFKLPEPAAKVESEAFAPPLRGG